MELRRTVFFFNGPATTEIYTLSLHDALPISGAARGATRAVRRGDPGPGGQASLRCGDRKSTRLNSSHSQISYAVFCLKKKNSTLASMRSTRFHVNSVRYFSDLLPILA